MILAGEWAPPRLRLLVCAVLRIARLSGTPRLLSQPPVELRHTSRRQISTSRIHSPPRLRCTDDEWQSLGPKALKVAETKVG